MDAVLPTSLRLVLGRLRAAADSDGAMEAAAEEERDRGVRPMPLLLRRPVRSGSCAVGGLHY